MPSHSDLHSKASIGPSGKLRIGYVSLTDAAPLIVAREYGLFTRHGLDVHLSRELGWGTIRDKIAYGELEAAHAPAGLLFSLLAGTHAPAIDVRSLMLLNRQGNAITLSKRLWHKGVRDGATLRQFIRRESPRKIVLAVVAWHSTHHHLLWDWLLRSGIQPDREICIIVVPPPLVGEHMRAGHIDGFCAGEPWNSCAVLRGDGWIAATSHDIAPHHPEKILLAPAAHIDADPGRSSALRTALLEACERCDRPDFRPELSLLLQRLLFPGLSVEMVDNALTGPCDLGAGAFSTPAAFHIFHAHQANTPDPAHGEWLLHRLESTRILRLPPDKRAHALSAFLGTPIHPPATSIS